MKPVSANRDSWIGEANCKELDVNFFYPGHGEPVPQEAKTACAECSVRTQCAEWAIHHEAHGYQGGMTPKQRQRARQEQNIFLWEPQTNVMVMGRSGQTRSQGEINKRFVIKHGTQSGYRMETKRGMEHCAICIKAHNRYTAWNKNRVAGTVPDVSMPTDLEVNEPMVDETGAIIENPKNLNEGKEEAYKRFLAS